MPETPAPLPFFRGEEGPEGQGLKARRSQEGTRDSTPQSRLPVPVSPWGEKCFSFEIPQSFFCREEGGMGAKFRRLDEG